MTDYFKLRLHLRGWLQGRAVDHPEYYDCLRAMDFAEKHHQGVRKDGMTPEFKHQIEIAQYLRTLHASLMYPAQTITAAFLHDVVEDYDIDIEIIRAEFGDMVANAVWRLTKKYRGVKKSMLEYFAELAKCPIASAVKGADRINNLQSMKGVFTREKQIAYAKEVVDHFLPMLKAARRMFPQQEPVYENIKLVLSFQLDFLETQNGT